MVIPLYPWLVPDSWPRAVPWERCSTVASCPSRASRSSRPLTMLSTLTRLTQRDYRGQRSPLPWLAYTVIIGYLRLSHNWHNLWISFCLICLSFCSNFFQPFWPFFFGFTRACHHAPSQLGRRSLVILVKIAVCKWCVNAYPSWSDIPRHTSCRQWIRPLTGAESGAGLGGLAKNIYRKPPSLYMNTMADGDFMVFHGISWYFMVFHGISWYFMVFHGSSCKLFVRQICDSWRFCWLGLVEGNSTRL